MAEGQDAFAGAFAWSILGTIACIIVLILIGGLDPGYGTYGAEQGLGFAVIKLLPLAFASVSFVYFISFLLKKEDAAAETKLSDVKLFEEGPWVFCVICPQVIALCINWLQTNEVPPEPLSNPYKRWGETPETRLGDLIAFCCWLLALFSYLLAVRDKKLVLFSIGSSWLVVQPLHMMMFYLIQKVLLPYGGQDPEVLFMRRETLLVVLYYVIPIVCGLANAYWIKIDYGYFTSKELDQVDFGKIMLWGTLWTVIPSAIFAFLPWSPATADPASMGDWIGDQGSLELNVWNMLWLCNYFQCPLFLALVYGIARGMNSFAFWRCFGICGQTAMRYLMGEQISVTYARRTVNMSYAFPWKQHLSWAVAFPLQDLPPYLLAACCGAAYLRSNTDDTLGLRYYQAYLAYMMVYFAVFALSYPLTGVSQGYFFSLPEALTYIFGVAVPVYHWFSYGILRTSDISAIKEGEAAASPGYQNASP